MKSDNLAKLRGDRVFLTIDACDIADFATEVQRTASLADYPTAASVEKNVLIYDAATVIAAAVILGYMTFGRVTYAVGANETAARFSGMAVDRAKLLIYTASGSMAALAAVIFVSRVSTTRSDMGMGIEMDAISAVVLGGTSLAGGRGGVHGRLRGGAERRELDLHLRDGAREGVLVLARLGHVV